MTAAHIERFPAYLDWLVPNPSQRSFVKFNKEVHQAVRFWRVAKFILSFCE